MEGFLEEETPSFTLEEALKRLPQSQLRQGMVVC